MNWPTFALAAVLGSWGLAAQSQDVVVRTGLHDTFTRIVLDFDRRPTWTLGRVEGGFELRTQQEGLRFDLSDAFRRIDRRRIAGLRDGGDGTIRIAVACDCHAETIELPNQGLVVDIVDGDAPAGNPHEIALDAAEPSPIDLPVLPRPLTLLPGRLTDAVSPGETGLRKRRRAETRQIVAEMLARGAAQGIVKPRDPLLVPSGRGRDGDDAHADSSGQHRTELDAATDPLAPQGPSAPSDQARGGTGSGESKRPDPSGIAGDPVLPDAYSGTPPHGRVGSDPLDVLRHSSNIHVETSIDRDRPGRRPVPDAVCLPADVVDVASWGSPDLAAGAVFTTRGDLVDATGRPDPAAFLKHGRQLIWMGFGAEARAELREAGAAEEAELARGLSRLVDGPAPVPSLVHQRECPTPAAMWAVLSDPAPKPGEEIAVEAVVETFATLPRHLRLHLGPRLVERVLSAGDRETALALEAALERTNPVPTPASEMMSARLSMDGLRPEAAEPILEKVSDSTGPEAVEAKTALIEARIASDRPVGEAILNDAEALAFEWRGTAEGEALRETHLRGLIHDGRIDDAFAVLSRPPQFAPDVAEDLKDEAHRAILETPDEAEFLRLSLRHAEAPIHLEEVRLGIAERLAEAELAGPAKDVLGRTATIPGRRERVLRARIAGIEGKTEIARSYLVGLEGEEIDELMHQIERSERVLARDALAAEPDVEQATEDAADTPLARNRSLLESSRETRAALADLLAR